ncbi:hypothetical protein GCM10027040_05550 [Halomonas shantousis]
MAIRRGWQGNAKHFADRALISQFAIETDVETRPLYVHMDKQGAHHMRRQLNPVLITALVAGGLTVGSHVMAQNQQQGQAQQGTNQLQGLYSADELLDADVYLASNRDEDIGDVEDILLGEDMSVQGLIFEAGGVLDIGDKDFVVEKGRFTVETDDSTTLDDLTYRVYLDMDREEIERLPEYNNEWWNRAKSQSAQAWQNTQEGAASAWENTKEGAASAWESTKDVTSDILDNASEAIDNDRDN